VEKPTRRRLLAAGFSGTALGLLGSRAVSASPDTTTPADDEGETSPESASVTTTTEPPQRPTQDDVPLLQFAESFELAARDLYQAAIDAGAEEETLSAIRGNHQASASILKGMLGTQGALSRSDEVFDRFEQDFATTDIAALAAAAYELESTAVATHTELVGELVGIDGAHLIASILVVEARQAVVMADLSGRGDDYDALFESDAEALSPGATSGG
jgi:ferritin-like protein